MSWTIFTVSAPREILTLSHNTRYLYSMEMEFDQEEPSTNLEHCSESGTPAPPSFQKMLVLRFTTAHRPKNPSIGFIFGTDSKKCDILLSTTRRTGISGKQFAITFHTTTGAVIIRNLSKQRTKIKEQGDRPTKLSTQKVLFGTNVTSIYLPCAELNISKPWQDGEHSTMYKAYLARLASVEPDIRALRLQSSAATGSSVTSVSNAYTRTTTRLGQGSSGIVYQGVHRQTGDLIAIKIYGERKREAKTEGNILQLLRHVRPVPSQSFE